MSNLGYILKQDLLNEIDTDTLTELTGGRKAIGSTAATAGKDYIWEQCRKSSIEYAKGYTRHFYDIETEMRPYSDYSALTTYTVGQRIAGTADSNGIRPLYVCILESTGNALSNTTYFTEIDDRNSVLVEIVCILIVYNLSRRYNPRQIPEQRQIDFDRVVSDLKNIQNGKIMLDIAEREDVATDDAGQEFAHGDFDNVTQDSY
jgi:hypothetical protein